MDAWDFDCPKCSATICLRSGDYPANRVYYTEKYKGGLMEETVTITKKEYEELKEDASIYRALQAAGVDNWEGWDFAMDLLDEVNNEN